MRKGDEEFIFILSREALGKYVDEIWGWRDEEQREYQKEWLARNRVQIIELEHERIGCLSIDKCADHVFVNRIALLPPWQGRGLGTALMLRVMEAAERRDVPVRLSVLENNPAKGLYDRLGFRVTAVEPPRIMMEWRPTP